jgi:hypothetical protein
MRIKNQFSTRNKLLWCVEITNNLVLLIYIFYVIFNIESYSEWRRLLVYFKLFQILINLLIYSTKEKIFNTEKMTMILIVFNIICYCSSFVIHYFLCYRLCIDVLGYYLHYFFIGVFFLILINFYFIVFWIYFENFEVPKYCRKFQIYETADI